MFSSKTCIYLFIEGLQPCQAHRVTSGPFTISNLSLAQFTSKNDAQNHTQNVIKIVSSILPLCTNQHIKLGHAGIVDPLWSNLSYQFKKQCKRSINYQKYHLQEKRKKNHIYIYLSLKAKFANTSATRQHTTFIIDRLISQPLKTTTKYKGNIENPISRKSLKTFLDSSQETGPKAEK